jgi:hypothetical protein
MESPKNSETATAVPAAMTPARILIVEDEQIVAVDLEGQLERLGYQVVGMAVSGEDACTMVASEQPDLILMDVRLDGPMDGIDAAHRIRQSWEVPLSSSPRTAMPPRCNGPTGGTVRLSGEAVCAERPERSDPDGAVQRDGRPRTAQKPRESASDP